MTSTCGPYDDGYQENNFISLRVKKIRLLLLILTKVHEEDLWKAMEIKLEIEYILRRFPFLNNNSMVKVKHGVLKANSGEKNISNRNGFRLVLEFRFEKN